MSTTKRIWNFAIFCLLFFNEFVFSDIYKSSRKNVLNQKYFTIRNCSFAVDNSFNSDAIICEHLTVPKRYSNHVFVNDFFLRTQFTFKILEETNASVNNVNFHWDEKTEDYRSATEMDSKDISVRRGEFEDEMRIFGISQEIGGENEADLIYTSDVRNESQGIKPNIISRTVTLTELKLHKIDCYDSWNNSSVTYLVGDFVLFLFMSQQFSWEMDFNSTFPIGVVDLEQECLHRKGRHKTCIKEMHFLRDAMPVDRHGYRFDFWGIVAKRHLRMQNCELTAGFKPRDLLSDDIFLKPMLNGTGLTQLHITGRSWPNLGPLMRNLDSLGRLDLSGNGINTIDTGIFNATPNVEELILARNNLQFLPEGISLLRHLKYLDISGNPIEYLHNFQKTFTRVLHNLIELRWLILSNTPLKSLHNLHGFLGPQEVDRYKSRTRLIGLDISYCDITTFNDVCSLEIFNEQTSLQSINLSGNKIDSIPSHLFYRLPHLRHLNLAFGPKLELPPGIILDSLDISHNRLSYPGDILKNGSVITLNLSYNEIHVWDDSETFACKTYETEFCFNSSEASSEPVSCNFVQKTVWVMNINLSNNALSTVSLNMGKSLNMLTQVDLGGNPFTCNNCTLIEFQKWLKDINSSVTSTVYLNNGTVSPLRCTEPYYLKNSFVIDVEFDPVYCRPMNGWIITYIVAMIVTAILIVVSVPVYIYRYEITYLFHLIKIKSRRRKMDLKDTDGFDYDAFVCYSGSDRTWVISEMLPRLENCPERFRLCLHERDFILGSYITLNVMNSMQRSRHTVVILTDSFVKSQWCCWELEMANHKLFEDGREFLILLELQRLDQTKVPRHLRFLMDTRTYLEWPEPGYKATTAWDRLKTSLGKSIHVQERESQFSET